MMMVDQFGGNLVLYDSLGGPELSLTNVERQLQFRALFRHWVGLSSIDHGELSAPSLTSTPLPL